MRTFYALVIALVAVVPASMAKPERCCAPDQMTGQVISAGMTQFTTTVDFTKRVAVEEFNGNAGIDYIVYDGNDKNVYIRKSSGECKKSAMNQEQSTRYHQCVPNQAVHQAMPVEDGLNVEGWRFNINNHSSRFVVILKDQCLPFRIHINRDDKMRTFHFVDVTSAIDQAALNKDLSDCVDA